jgi:hypothetical protein
MPLIALVVFVVLAVIVLIPFSIVQRFRLGTAQRIARGWVASLNIAAVLLSVLLFLMGALITSRWVPEALGYTSAGLGAGIVLGFIGVLLTRWEYSGGRLRYTPNRWLVLGITVVVAARVLYGFWRTWETWRGFAALTGVAASEVAASMAAGAVVLGYYLVFWIGIRWRLRHSR